MIDKHGNRLNWEVYRFDHTYYIEINYLILMYKLPNELLSVINDLKESQDRANMIIAIELINNYLKNECRKNTERIQYT